jgi:hypothetical protein
MTVGELIERLEEMDPDAEIRLMTQENYPFENSIAGVTDSEEIIIAAEQDDEFTPAQDRDRPTQGIVVYIVEGQQLGYGNKAAWNIL